MNDKQKKPAKPQVRMIAGHVNRNGRTAIDHATSFMSGPKCLLVLILAVLIGLSVVFDSRFFSVGTDDNVLDAVSALSPDTVNWKRLERYVNYLVEHAQANGLQSIADKWAENVPDRFKKSSENRLELLVRRGFVVSEVSLDMKGVYTVRCEIGNSDQEAVSLDIVKERIEDDSQVFRILRIH
jgi:hypothetical protein